MQEHRNFGCMPVLAALLAATSFPFTCPSRVDVHSPVLVSAGQRKDVSARTSTMRERRMASLNPTAHDRTRTTNLSGHDAYLVDDRTNLAIMALTTLFGEDKYYGDNTGALLELAAKLCREGMGLYVAKLAVWTRTKGNLRSVSHALAATVAHECSGEPFVRPMVHIICSQRGDDGIEVLAAHKALYGSRVRWPHALQRGVRDALEQMDATSIAKYQLGTREMKMRDALRICHPVPRDEEADEAMRACVAGKLRAPKGWETELSERGNKAEVWDELIAEGRLGYMALLRNLRSIISSGADVTPVLERLGDAESVHQSRQLPFRTLAKTICMS